MSWVTTIGKTKVRKLYSLAKSGWMPKEEPILTVKELRI